LHEFDQNQIIQNFKVLNLKKKGYKAKDSFSKPFDKKLCSMGSKCLAIDVGHMCMKYSCQKTCLVVHWN